MERLYDKLIAPGAPVALAGYILSGAVGFIIVRAVKPQPAWTPAAALLAFFVLMHITTGFLVIYMRMKGLEGNLVVTAVPAVISLILLTICIKHQKI